MTTTQQMLDQPTEHGLAGDVFTVYCGCSTDRRTLRKAHAEGKLCFSVNRSHIGAKLGERTTIGFYDCFASAVAALPPEKHWRISAHYHGQGGVEECILHASWWHPLAAIIG